MTSKDLNYKVVSVYVRKLETFVKKAEDRAILRLFENISVQKRTFLKMVAFRTVRILQEENDMKHRNVQLKIFNNKCI